MEKFAVALEALHAGLCCRGDMTLFREELWKCTHACLDAKSVMERNKQLYGRTFWDIVTCCNVLESIPDMM